MLFRSQVPATRLSAKDGPLLGWTTWLRTKPYALGEATVRLSPRRLGRDRDHAATRGREDLRTH